MLWCTLKHAFAHVGRQGGVNIGFISFTVFVRVVIADLSKWIFITLLWDKVTQWTQSFTM